MPQSLAPVFSSGHDPPNSGCCPLGPSSSSLKCLRPPLDPSQAERPRPFQPKPHAPLKLAEGGS